MTCESLFPGLFPGETMHCALCKHVTENNPEVESSWKSLLVEDTVYHVCPFHYPPDESNVQACTAAILNVWAKLLPISKNRKNGGCSLHGGEQ